MPSRKEFIRAFERATERSSRHDLFGSMVSALGGTLNSDGRSIDAVLDTRGRGPDNTVVENAVRLKFGDDLRRSRYPDVLFNGIPVEVKHTTSGFGKLPTDSRGLTNTDRKWYLFAKGDVQRVESDPFTIWLMRSDELHAEMLTLLQNVGDQMQLFKREVPNSIDPASPDAIEEIEREIGKISRGLATVIQQRAMPDSDQGPTVNDDISMSLHRRVGVNRVRFDVKFESILRDTIARIIRD